MRSYHKTRPHPPLGFFPAEAAGLRWLAAAQRHGGPRVAQVLEVAEDHLDIELIDLCSPTRQAAQAFGAALARLHDAGATCFGAAPAGYTGTCYFGPLQDPVPMATGSWTSVADYLADGRLRPMLRQAVARGQLNDSDWQLTEAVITALPNLLGQAAADRPARVHGDLWSGNLLWTRQPQTGQVEAVLIDPAAHGGHREEDLAMLDLFGVPYQSDILDGYQSVHPLAAGFRRRLTLWQLYPIAGHCVFFGGGYVSQYRAMCRNLLR